MKKISTTTLLLTVCALLACVLTACDPIGYKLEQEIPLSNGIVTGNVYSMVPVNGKLYTCNGRIYTKSFTGDEEWSMVEKPAGKMIVALASDNSYLYAMDSSCTVWVTNVSTDITVDSWQEAGTASRANGGLIDNGTFSTSDGTTTDRNAYIVLSDGAHQLQGATHDYNATAAAGSTANTKNCVVLTTGDTFYDQFMVASNGTDKVYKVSGTERSSSTLDLNGTSKTTDHAITYLFYAGENQLLVGTKLNYEIWNTETKTGTEATETTASLASYSILGIWEYGDYRYASRYDEESSSYSGLWAKKTGGTWDKQ